MNGALYRVVYVSSAQRYTASEDLNAILDVSRQNNASRDITGLLLFHDGSYFQVLEGPRGAVEERLRVIGADKRHTGMITVLSEPVTMRGFPEWSMGFVPFNGLDSLQRRGYFDLRRALDRSKAKVTSDDPIISVMMDSFLRSFRDLAA